MDDKPEDGRRRRPSTASGVSGNEQERSWREFTDWPSLSGAVSVGARLLVILLLLGTLLAAPLSATVVGAAAQAPSGGGDQPAPPVWDTGARCIGADAATATQAQADARSLASDLRQLAAAHPGLVPQQRLTGINRSLENGATELELGQYEQACKAFTIAAEQARGALRTYYPEATRANLNTAKQVIDHHGADDPARESALENRHDRLTDRLSTTSAVSDHARLYRQSEDLLADARELKPTLLERVLAALPLGVTVLLCLSLAVLLVQYLLGDDDPPGPDINQ